MTRIMVHDSWKIYVEATVEVRNISELRTNVMKYCALCGYAILDGGHEHMVIKCQKSSQLWQLILLLSKDYSVDCLDTHTYTPS